MRARGLKVHMAPCEGGQFYLLTGDPNEAILWARLMPSYGIHPNGVVCHNAGSARGAKQRADRHERGTFTWGRYCFTGRDDKTLDTFRRALVGR